MERVLIIKRIALRSQIPELLLTACPAESEEKGPKLTAYPKSRNSF